MASMLRWLDRGCAATGNCSLMVMSVICCGRCCLQRTRRLPDAIFLNTGGGGYTTRRIYIGICAAPCNYLPGLCVPAPLPGAIGRIGGALEHLLRAPYKSRICSRLLDSACYRSIRTISDPGFCPMYKLEDALHPIMQALHQQANRKT